MLRPGLSCDRRHHLHLCCNTTPYPKALNSCLNLTMAKRRKEGTHAKQSPPLVQFSEEEQLRLIEQTGILKEIPVSGQKPEASSTIPQASVEEEEEEYPLAEEVFAATTLLIPMSFLLLMMYM
jgi:hypothetical protein